MHRNVGPLLLQCTVDYTVSTVIIRCSGSVVGHTEPGQGDAFVGGCRVFVTRTDVCNDNNEARTGGIQ